MNSNYYPALAPHQWKRLAELGRAPQVSDFSSQMTADPIHLMAASEMIAAPPAQTVGQIGAAAPASAPAAAAAVFPPIAAMAMAAKAVNGTLENTMDAINLPARQEIESKAFAARNYAVPNYSKPSYGSPHSYGRNLFRFGGA